MLSLHTHAHREVRVPQTNGLGAGLSGGSSPLSRSHELLPQQGAASFGDGGGMVYGGEILSDDVRSDVNVGGAILPHYRRPSTKSTGGAPLPVPSSVAIQGHSNSFSSRLPNQKSNYRTVTVGNSAGGASVPVSNQQHSPSHSHSLAPAGIGIGGGAGAVKTPPQRRANYQRHDILRDASQLMTSQG